MGEHQFGGDWTHEKLERVRQYLVAYTTAMHKQPFRLEYIDAFAGTGYVSTTRGYDSSNALWLPDLAEREARRFMEGSARIALQVEPQFDGYIFIERDEEHAQHLELLRVEFAGHTDRIAVVRRDANSYLCEFCRNRSWTGRRAVLFLDPYGMQVAWNTIEAIAETQAIDMWILFPLGVAVNRLLPKDGKINEGWSRRLDLVFGTHEWSDAFYKTEEEETLFGSETRTEKTATPESIGRYFVSRLRKVFAAVADNPLPLYNSKNSPLYLLCFAAANPKGAPIAVKIAQHILKR